MTNIVYKYPHSNDNSQYASDCKTQRNCDLRFANCDLFAICELIRTSQIDNRNSAVHPDNPGDPLDRLNLLDDTVQDIDVGYQELGTTFEQAVIHAVGKVLD